MSKKRVKKSSPISQAKLADKQNKKRFLKSVQQLIDGVSGKQLFKELPSKMLDLMYSTRYYPLQFKLPPELKNITKIDFLNKILKIMLHSQKIKILPGDMEINMSTFTTAWITIVTFLNFFPEDKYQKVNEIKKELFPYIQNKENIDECMLNIDILLFTISSMFSNIDKITHFVYATEDKDNNTYSRTFQNITIRVYTASWRKFIINGENHLACQFGGIIPIKGFCWFTITLDKFKHNATLGELPIEVYIQKHAIQRYKERIDCIPEDMKILNTFDSFEKPKITQLGNKYFFEYRAYGAKAGYFIGQLIDGAFVIQTFLFLTNNGTPEGEKLNKTFGIEIDDKKYLAIDKLSTFINLSNEEAEELQNLFSECGINHLFEIRKRLLNFEKNPQETIYKGKIKDYLTFDGDTEVEFEEIEEPAFAEIEEYC